MTRPVPLQPSHGVTQPELAVHTRAVRRTSAGGGGGTASHGCYFSVIVYVQYKGFTHC